MRCWLNKTIPIKMIGRQSGISGLGNVGSIPHKEPKLAV